MRAMIVDDEPLCLNDMIYLLSRSGTVEIAGAFTEPASALEAALKIRPDVFFLDLVMPRMSGAELAKQILAQIPAARIVFVTAFAKELESVKGIPAFGSLYKPVSGDMLGELLSRLRAEPKEKQETNAQTKS